MAIKIINLPPPPRVTGTPQQQALIVGNYVFKLHEAVKNRMEVIESIIIAIGVLPLLDPDTASTTDNANKINDIIEAAGD